MKTKTLSHAGRCLSLTLLAALSASCSLVLDPENCSTDGDCNGGVCQDGICVGPTTATPDQGLDAEPDVTLPDVGPDMSVDVGDTQVSVDVPVLDASDAAPDGPPPQAPTCALDVEARLVADNPLSVGVVVGDDRPLDELTVTVNEVPVTVSEAGEGVAAVPLEEGENALVLTVVDGDGLRCTARETVVGDFTLPVLEMEPIAPAISAGAITIGGRLVDRNYAPVLYLNDELAEPEWQGGGLFALSLPLAQGDNDFVLTGQDLAGNVSLPFEFSVLRDEVGPDIAITEPANGASTEEPNTWFRGQVTSDGVPEARIRVSVSAQGPSGAPTTSQVRADASGRFQAEVALKVGRNTLTACAADELFNERCESVQVTRQSAAACIEVTQVQPSVADGARFLTSTAQLTVSGTVCPSVTRVLAQSEGVNVETVPANGAFSVVVDLPAAGARQLVLTGEGPFDSAEDTVDLLFDNTNPQVAISRPSAGCTNLSQVQVCGSATDAETSILSARVNATAAERRPDGTYCAQVALPEGEQTLSLVARNQVNREGTASVTLSVDRTAPVVRFAQPENSWYGVNISGGVALSGSVETGLCGVNRLFIGGIEAGINAGQFAVSREVPDGEQALAVLITDLAGNQAQSLYRLRVDSQAPTVTLETPARVITGEAAVPVSVLVNDAGSGISEVSIGGVVVAGTPVAGGTRFQRDVPVASVLTAGNPRQGTIAIRAIDALDNTRAATVEVIEDLAGPTLSVTSPGIGAQVSPPLTVTGTVSDGALGSGVESVTVNGVLAEVDAGGAWRARGVPVAADGLLTVTAVDVEGNESAPLTRQLAVADFGVLDQTEYGLLGAEQVAWLAPAYVNGDARVDLIALTGVAGETSSLYLQQADGTFVASPAGLPTGAIRDAALGDFNDDGRIDLVVVGSSIGGLYLNNGQGFTLQPTATIPPNAELTGITTGDINRDGHLDLVLTGGVATRVLMGQAGGGLERLNTLAELGLTDLAQMTGVELLDLNRDGVLDLVASSATGGRLWLGTRAGTFNAVNPFVAMGTAFVPLDSDSEGTLDLLSLGALGQLLDNSAGAFTQEVRGLESLVNATAAVPVDGDGDGDEDVVALSAAGVTFWRQSVGSFTQVNAATTGLNLGAATALAAADLDDDGDVDLITGTADGLRIARSNQTLRNQNYRYVRVLARRAGVADGVGVQVLASVDGNPETYEHAVLGQPSAPTVISLGPNPSLDLGVLFVDLGAVGGNVRGPGASPGDTVEVGDEQLP